MEKGQHNNTAAGPPNNENSTGSQPGQQLPAGDKKEQLDHPAMSEEDVRHSSSSFPQSDNETLGTP